MYFNSETVHVARLAALDHYQSASNILLDSTARLIDLYNDTGSQALGLARCGEARPDADRFKQLVPNLFMGHLRIAGHAHENLVRLLEAQIHSSSNLAKFTLDKTAQMSPPLVELAIDAVGSIIAAGESVSDELGNASIKAVGEVEKKLGRSSRAKKQSRS
ncbi:MAG: hypothetical protein Q7U97_10685 [Rhodocyclaceae bacterium]|nr:hypothetical protein [Rhodocyclaceae bacterium]